MTIVRKKNALLLTALCAGPVFGASKPSMLGCGNPQERSWGFYGFYAAAAAGTGFFLYGANKFVIRPFRDMRNKVNTMWSERPAAADGSAPTAATPAAAAPVLAPASVGRGTAASVPTVGGAAGSANCPEDLAELQRKHEEVKRAELELRNNMFAQGEEVGRLRQQVASLVAMVREQGGNPDSVIAEVQYPMMRPVSFTGRRRVTRDEEPGSPTGPRSPRSMSPSRVGAAAGGPDRSTPGHGGLIHVYGDAAAAATPDDKPAGA